MESQEDAARPAESAPAKRPRRWPRVLLLVVVVMVVGGVLIWYQAGGKYRWSEPYLAAMAQVQKAPEVVALLGEPIHDVLFSLSGSVRGENAHLMFKIAGPKGRAVVQTDARVFGGKWATRMLTVTLPDGKRISLDAAPEAGGAGDAPVWPAAGGPAPKAPAASPKVPPPVSPGPDIQLDMPDLTAPEKAPSDKKAPEPKPAGK